MAQSILTSGGTVYIPGAYVKTTVKPQPAGVATTGVLMLVGEADAGEDYTLEDDLSKNVFGPTSAAAVLAKYGSGPLVDAFLKAVQPGSDNIITGAPATIVLAKTNAGTKASANLPAIGGGTYATLDDKSYGKLGNLIYFDVSQYQAQVVPTTGQFTWIPNVGTVGYKIIANGDVTTASGLFPAGSVPSDVATALATVDTTVTGGALRALALTLATNHLTLTVVSGNTVRVDYDGTFGVTPTVGDTLVIPIGSVVAGASGENVGGYVVTAATSASITATKLSDGGSGSAVAGTITAPANVASAAVAAATDIDVYSPITVSSSVATPVSGQGLSLEIADTGTGTDTFNSYVFQLDTTPVTWISTSTTPYVLTSSAEYKVKLTDGRKKDGIVESFIAGGDVGLTIGYVGTTASVTVSTTGVTGTATGGTGASFPSSGELAFADYPTIADLVAYINTLTGWTASAGTATLGQLPSSALDQVTVGCVTVNGVNTGRVKLDAYRFYNAVADTQLVQLGATPARAAAGLPDVATTAFLSGGTKGGTSDGDVLGALAALEKVDGNMVVTLFSRDATADITDGLTDGASTYTIAAVNSNLKTHVDTMSTIKRRRNRQGIASYRGTFNDALDAAANMADFTMAMAFQDFKATDSTGSVKTFHPWMTAVDAAAMQLAGGVEPIIHKYINTVGVLQAAGDFNDQDDTQVEEALKAGLLVAKRVKTGGYHWVSDQTTYSKDSNFLYNSLQAVYVANIIALTVLDGMDNAIVGRPNSKVSAPVALSDFRQIMGNLLKAKFIVADDTAPRGYRNATAVLTGGGVVVNAEVKQAGAIYFVPVGITVSPVQQTA